MSTNLCTLNTTAWTSVRSKYMHVGHRPLCSAAMSHVRSPTARSVCRCVPGCVHVGSTPRDAYPVGPRPQRSTPEHVHEIVLVTSWVSSWLNRDIVPSRSRSAAAKRDSGPQSAAAGVNATFSQASTCSAMHGMQSRSALFGRAVGSLSSICPMRSRRGAL